MNKKFKSYLSKEIGIDIKTCLYFFCIIFFYCVYRIINGIWDARIVHMAQMMAAAYIISYFQVYVLDNFDEADSFGKKEFFYSLICSFIYAIISRVLNWFDKNAIALITFFVYMTGIYVCVFATYKIKRNIDTKNLNNDLKAFKERNKQDE